MSLITVSRVRQSAEALPFAAKLDCSAQDLPILPGSVRQHSVSFKMGLESIPRFDTISLPPELTKAVPRRQLEFRAGRYCAAQALAGLIGDPWSAVGRRADGSAVWPSGIVGSITHTAGFASAAVAPASAFSGVGIDAEMVVSRQRAVSIAETVASPAEFSRWRLAGFDVPQAVTATFSVKEAVFKCLFPLVGRRFGFHDALLETIDVNRGVLGLRLVTTLSGTFNSGMALECQFAFEDDYVRTGIALQVRGLI